MDSSRVRLEVAILADEAVPAVAPQPPDETAHLTILVVAADADVRCYVQECLRDRHDTKVVAAASVTDALVVAAHDAPRLMIVDAPQCEVLVALPQLAALVIVDEVPRRERRAGALVRFLGRPFSRDALSGEVDRLLG